MMRGFFVTDQRTYFQWEQQQESRSVLSSVRMHGHTCNACHACKMPKVRKQIFWSLWTLEWGAHPNYFSSTFWDNFVPAGEENFWFVNFFSFFYLQLPCFPCFPNTLICFMPQQVADCAALLLPIILFVDSFHSRFCFHFLILIQNCKIVSLKDLSANDSSGHPKMLKSSPHVGC